MNYDLKRVSLLHFIWKGEVEKSETEHIQTPLCRFLQLLLSYLGETLGIKFHASICSVMNVLPLFEKQLRQHCRVFIKNH